MRLALRGGQDFFGRCVSFRNRSVGARSSVGILVASVEVGSAGKRQISM